MFSIVTLWHGSIKRKDRNNGTLCGHWYQSTTDQRDKTRLESHRTPIIISEMNAYPKAITNPDKETASSTATTATTTRGRQCQEQFDRLDLRGWMTYSRSSNQRGDASGERKSGGCRYVLLCRGSHVWWWFDLLLLLKFDSCVFLFSITFSVHAERWGRSGKPNEHEKERRNFKIS